MTQIRERRKQMGLTIFNVAVETKVREAHISAIENRRIIAFPGQRKVLADFLGMAESDLFDANGFAK